MLGLGLGLRLGLELGLRLGLGSVRQYNIASVKTKVQDVYQTSLTFNGMFFKSLALKPIEFFEKL